MNKEVHLFVFWPLSRAYEERALADMAEHAEILARIESAWPEGMSADKGYRLFYGPGLPDAVGKAKRAGIGRFLIVVVRLTDPHYDWRMTQRGFELVNVDMFDLKWRYRGWMGGLHRVHGTASTDEARRDILLLTGQPLEAWVDGSADPNAVVTLSEQALATAGEAPTAQPPVSLEEARAYFRLPEAEVVETGLPGTEVGRGHELQQKVWETDATVAPKPLLWHVGARGVVYIARERIPAVPLAARLASGAVSASVSDGAAASVPRLIAALDGSGVVHRNINPETLLVGEGGHLALVGFELGVRRDKYKVESKYFRKDLAGRLIPLGGDGVPRPGCWNDRYALAQCLKKLPRTDALTVAIAELERAAAAGQGTLRVALKKLRLRFIKLYVCARGSAAEVARLRAFVKGAFGFGGKCA